MALDDTQIERRVEPHLPSVTWNTPNYTIDPLHPFEVQQISESLMKSKRFMRST